jgi:hypothetical protein
VTFGVTGDAVVDGVMPSSGTVVLIAPDDGGAGPDDNHDDLVVRLELSNGTFTTVPEPATLALFGMGLLGLGLASRRLRSEQASQISAFIQRGGHRPPLLHCMRRHMAAERTLLFRPTGLQACFEHRRPFMLRAQGRISRRLVSL